ncbi:MAG: right-handed parallel beta-helix repeat-containing protein [Cyclobacteriaceae bacterium]|nr:right-handed parallel beta-helix repeat-containing protein [Cyclobacteriaceae bacterium HetDA_MAG_MS6]
MRYVGVLIYFIFPLLALAQPFYNVQDYGAIGDGKAIDTEYIQKTIDACADNGGGTVLFVPGTYLSGTVNLKKNVSIHLAAGSVLMGSPNIEDYSGKKKALINALEVSGLEIVGKGTINGNGYAFWNEDWTYKERPSPLILFTKSKNVTFRDIKIIDSPSHTIRMQQCSDFKFDGLTIINPLKSANTDGIDIVDSRNVTISNCFMSSGDDLICLKSQKDTVENVVVTNCILESDDAAIKFGTGSAVATRYNTFDNIVIRNTRYGISLFMLMGGIFEHNRFSNIIIETGGRHQHQYPIFIDIDRRLPEYDLGQVRHNTFANIDIVTSGKLLISGNPDKSIEDITLRDVHLIIKDEADFSKAKKPRGNKFFPKLEGSPDLSRKPAHIVIGHVDEITLDNVTIDAGISDRKSYYKSNVKEQ